MPISFDLNALNRFIRGRAIGVVTTPAGWLTGVGAFSDWVAQHADVRGFLALEHGLRGELQDGVLFDSYTDSRTGRPVFSYYGRKEHTLPDEFLSGVDAVVFHAQDVSHRAYTYQLALADTLFACARLGKALIVLDRPSPLAHLGCSGPLAPQFFPEPLPLLLPFTLGELALWLKTQRRLDVELTVVPVVGWRRSMPWPETGLPWIPPSPNIPTLDSAYAYAMTGIIQATNVSEWRGTCKPFEYFGAPFVKGDRLAAALDARHLPGLVFREVYFKPGFNKFAGEICAGVHLIIAAPELVEPIRTMFAILHELARLHPAEFHVLPGLPHWLDQGAWPAERLATLDVDTTAAAMAAEGHEFLTAISPLLAYP